MHVKRYLAASCLSLLLLSPAIPVQGAPSRGAGEHTFSYGAHALQTLDFTPAVDAKRPAPLILFVHGGGWKRGSKDNATGRYMAPHYTGEGYSFATMNYQLVPEATVEQQAQDIADALAWLLARADSLGIDRSRVVLMGHSAGAHLVALVGTDQHYLRKAGLSYRDVSGIVSIDGAAYDVQQQIAQGGRFMRRTYLQAFGKDPARQRALSPTMHAAAPNAPAFLLLHVQRDDGSQQARQLEAALNKAGSKVERQEFEGEGLRGHAQINRELGNPEYPATGALDDWLKRILR
jgi:acetyl esterase/lipase